MAELHRHSDLGKLLGSFRSRRILPSNFPRSECRFRGSVKNSVHVEHNMNTVLCRPPFRVRQRGRGTKLLSVVRDHRSLRCSHPVNGKRYAPFSLPTDRCSKTPPSPSRTSPSACRSPRPRCTGTFPGGGAAWPRQGDEDARPGGSPRGRGAGRGAGERLGGALQRAVLASLPTQRPGAP